MVETYSKMVPKAFGWTPGKYLENKGIPGPGMATMNNPHFQGRETNEDEIRKMEELLAKYVDGGVITTEEYRLVEAILSLEDF
jgi:hypothetical protein